MEVPRNTQKTTSGSAGVAAPAATQRRVEDGDEPARPSNLDVPRTHDLPRIYDVEGDARQPRRQGRREPPYRPDRRAIAGHRLPLEQNRLIGKGRNSGGQRSATVLQSGFGARDEDAAIRQASTTSQSTRRLSIREPGRGYGTEHPGPATDHKPELSTCDRTGFGPEAPPRRNAAFRVPERIKHARGLRDTTIFSPPAVPKAIGPSRPSGFESRPRHSELHLAAALAAGAPALVDRPPARVERLAEPAAELAGRLAGDGDKGDRHAADLPESHADQSATSASSSPAIAGAATSMPRSAGGAGASSRTSRPARSQMSAPAATSQCLTPRS
jgi:hypothetical protein